MTYRILITGTRNELDRPAKAALWNRVRTEINMALLHDERVTVIHGACPTGVDSLMDELPLTWPAQVSVERHPADWEKHGRAAGPLRNAHMVSLGADVCLAFPQGASRGTRGCARLAKEAGIPTVVTEL